MTQPSPQPYPQWQGQQPAAPYGAPSHVAPGYGAPASYG